MNKFQSLIVSDYDGTIRRNDNINELITSAKILKALVSYQISFMISTGRLFESIYRETNDYSIPFSFLSCANGNILFDSSYGLLWKKEVEPKIIQVLKPFNKYIISIEKKMNMET